MYYGDTSGGVPLPGTFKNCKKLEYAYIDCPGADENIIFDGCDKLEKVVIGPNGSICEYFKAGDMPNLKYIEIEPNNIYDLFSDDDILYQRNRQINGEKATLLVAVPNAKEGIVNIADGVDYINDYAFNGCKDIVSVVIPPSVSGIYDYAFQDCGIKSIEVPHTVKELRSSVFSKKLFHAHKIDVYLYGAPKINPNGRQTFYGMGEGSRLFAFSNIIKPENKFSTSNLPQITIFDKPIVEIRPTSITIKDIKLSNIDDVLSGLYFEETKGASQGGLDPNANNGVTYYMKTGKHGIAEGYYSFKTPSLKLSTLQPKVTKAGEAIVCATTNMDDAEIHAGFEWRKTDAPDVVQSKMENAVIYSGTMEGKIKNLDTSSYWKVRAFYKSNSGKMYYGDWIGFDPSDFSYFEPTVHTYNNPVVDGNSVMLTGAVVEGSDEIQEQGFEYWKDAANAREVKRVPSNVQRVTATGQRMTVTLTGLARNSTYGYRTYVKTAKGIFYGEEQTFTTEGGETETPFEITTSAAGYATFYDSMSAYSLPTELTAQVVTGIANNKLVYETIGSTVPKGVAVMLSSSSKRATTYTLNTTTTDATYSGTNLLHGSDAPTTTTGNGYHYKLSFGKSGGALSNVFGWYWGAWLVWDNFTLTYKGSATGIRNIQSHSPAAGLMYDLQGRRINSPTAKGVYIVNGKKVTIK